VLLSLPILPLNYFDYNQKFQDVKIEALALNMMACHMPFMQEITFGNHNVVRPCNNS